MEIRFTDGSYTDGGERIMLDPTVYPDWQIGRGGREGAAAGGGVPPAGWASCRRSLFPTARRPSWIFCASWSG